MKEKMKKVGYICLGFACVCSILKMLGILTDESTLPLIYYWGGLGITLLFGNSAKRIVGAKTALGGK